MSANHPSAVLLFFPYFGLIFVVIALTVFSTYSLTKRLLPLSVAAPRLKDLLVGFVGVWVMNVPIALHLSAGAISPLDQYIVQVLVASGFLGLFGVPLALLMVRRRITWIFPYVTILLSIALALLFLNEFLVFRDLGNGLVRFQNGLIEAVTYFVLVFSSFFLGILFSAIQGGRRKE